MAERLRGWAGAALVLVAALLPFELQATLPLGPLRLSSVELVLYAALALWAAARVAAFGRADLRRLGRPSAWPVAHRAAALLALVLLLSALTAPALRATALKFALRSWGGLLLFAAAADLLRAPEILRRTLVALVGGALVAAALAVAETRLPASAHLLRGFHGQTFQALGLARGSGPFQFPNIAAMALEAAIPVAIALGAAAVASPVAGVARFGTFAVTAAPLVLLGGVVATASRAGLLGALAAILALTVFMRRDPRTRHAGRTVLLACAALTALGLASTAALASRLAFWRDGRWYAADIRPAGGPADRLPGRLAASATATELLEVRNQGALLWRRDSPGQVALSYHWIDGSGQVAIVDGARTPIPGDVPRGAAVTVRAAVQAPARPGAYLLWWDMVHEGVTWFSGRAGSGFREQVLVGDVLPGPPARPIDTPELAPPTVARRRLWRAAVTMFREHPVLGVGPDNFRHLYGRYLGLPRAEDRLHANSLYFETLADLGLAGLGALGLWMVVLGRAARRAVAAPAARPLAVGVSVALGTFLLHGALDYFFEFTPTYAMFWLLAGALVALDPGTPEMLT